MDGTKKAKGLQAKEQQRKHRRAKYSSKKRRKKGLEEYMNDLTKENHSQASSSRTQQSTPSLQKETRVSPREGRPPVGKEDCKAKDKEVEKEVNHLKGKSKASEEKGLEQGCESRKRQWLSHLRKRHIAKEVEKELNQLIWEWNVCQKKDSASCSTRRGRPSLQNKRVFPCEGGPAVKEKDTEVKDKKLEETKKQQITSIKNEQEMMVLAATKTCIKGGNNALETTSTLVEEDKTNVMLPRDAEKFSMDDVLSSKNSIQENGKFAYSLILPRLDEDVGDNCIGEICRLEEENVKLEEKIAKLKEGNSKLEEEIAKLEEENAKLEAKLKEERCEEGLEQGYESLEEREVLLRQWLSDFHKSRTGKAINKALMTWGRKKYRKEFINMSHKFSAVIAVSVEDEDANKLNHLKEIAESWQPKDKGVLKDLEWNQKFSKCYFVLCKTVAIWNAEKFQPNIKGVEGTGRIKKMHSNGELIFENVDVGEFMVTQSNHNKV